MAKGNRHRVARPVAEVEKAHGLADRLYPQADGHGPVSGEGMRPAPEIGEAV